MAVSKWVLQSIYDKKDIDITKPKFEAGRRRESDISCRSSVVSRHHAVFTIHPNGTLYVQDNKTCNGTYVNHRKIHSDKPHQLYANDEVGLGLCSSMELPPSDKKEERYIYLVKKVYPDELIVIDDLIEENAINGSHDKESNSKSFNSDQNNMNTINARKQPLSTQGLLDVLEDNQEEKINKDSNNLAFSNTLLIKNKNDSNSTNDNIKNSKGKFDSTSKDGDNFAHPSTLLIKNKNDSNRTTDKTNDKIENSKDGDNFALPNALLVKNKSNISRTNDKSTDDKIEKSKDTSHSINKGSGNLALPYVKLSRDTNNISRTNDKTTNSKIENHKGKSYSSSKDGDNFALPNALLVKNKSSISRTNDKSTDDKIEKSKDTSHSINKGSGNLAIPYVKLSRDTNNISRTNDKTTNSKIENHKGKSYSSSKDDDNFALPNALLVKNKSTISRTKDKTTNNKHENNKYESHSTNKGGGNLAIPYVKLIRDEINITNDKIESSKDEFHFVHPNILHKENEDPVQIKEEIPALNDYINYTFEDGCITISDDEDDLPCSQFLENKLTPKDDNADVLSDSIFCVIKKELEELDRPEEGRVYAHVDLESSDDDSLGWFSLQPDKSLNNKDAAQNEENIKKLDHTNKRKYVEPPIIPPHSEVKAKKAKYTQPKRKKPEQNDEVDLKKMKTDMFYSKTKEESGLKSKPRSISTETKNQIMEVRKQKLKEIARKSSTESENKTSVAKSGATKIKVSDSRGKFLTESVSAPSTSKWKEETKKFKIPIQKTKPSKTPDENNKKHTGSTSTEVVSYYVPKLAIPTLSVPKSKPNIESNCDDIEDVLVRFLRWKIVWFKMWEEQKLTAPLHDHPPNKMKSSFLNFSDYYNTVIPLLEMELWYHLHKAQSVVNDARNQTFVARIQTEIKRQHCTELYFITYIGKKQLDEMCYIKEQDAVIVQFAFKKDSLSKIQTVPLLGYVTKVSRRILHSSDVIEEPLVNKVQVDPHATVYFRVMLQPIEGTVVLEKYSFVKILSSLIPSLRVIRSVKYLEYSPLCKHVLSPSIELYAAPTPLQQELVSQDRLNNSQQRAVMAASNLCVGSKPGILLIQGPPGTGKTRVIINIIQQIFFHQVNAKGAKDCCLLVVAPSNAAVDEITSRLINLKPKLEVAQRKEIKLVRMGPPNMINPAVKDYSAHELAKKNVIQAFLSNSKDKQLEPLRKKHQSILAAKINGLSEREVYKDKMELEREVSRRLGPMWYENLKKTEAVIVSKARIICSTLSSCIGQQMQQIFGSSQKILCCIVDEATQSTEQETLIPLKLGIDKLVLVGDPKQLPAVTLSKEAKFCGYGQSLFSRIMSHFGKSADNPVLMLDTQYRMHPAICSFPNKTFYQAKLKTADEVLLRKNKLNILKPYIVFHLVADFMNSQEYSNRMETGCVEKLLEAINNLVKNSCNYSVGVITPYNDQKENIKRKIQNKRFKPNVSITVNTVDSFQGQEKDIIIISLVREQSNNFVRDEQRLNVALTRAVHALYIIGSETLFRTCSTLGRVYDDAVERGLSQNINSRTSVNSCAYLIRNK